MQDWQVVKNPERPSLRRRNEFLLALMNRQISDRHNRQIELHRLPAFAVVKRNVYAGLGAGVEEPAFVWILSDHSRKSCFRNSAGNLFPTFTVVVGSVEI